MVSREVFGSFVTLHVGDNILWFDSELIQGGVGMGVGMPQLEVHYDDTGKQLESAWAEVEWPIRTDGLALQGRTRDLLCAVNAS